LEKAGVDPWWLMRITSNIYINYQGNSVQAIHETREVAEEEPIEVFKCQSVEHCPGGIPGICPGGREGIPCADCPPGTSWSGEECVQCSNGLVVIPFLGAEKT